jgi:predicted Fe-Mo cluster-binding NifX family protein
MIRIFIILRVISVRIARLKRKERILIDKMDLLIAVGTDDGEYLNNDHVGMARYYYVYRYSDGKVEYVEKRINVEFTGDETMKHGDPEKAKSTSTVLEGIDVIVGRKFGPNITRLLKNFVCVLVVTDTIHKAMETVLNNMDKLVLEKNRASERKHIILKPQKT